MGSIGSKSKSLRKQLLERLEERCHNSKPSQRRRHIVKVLSGDTECPLQVCQLSRSSENTHFLSHRRDVALFDSTRAPDGS